MLALGFITLAVDVVTGFNAEGDDRDDGCPATDAERTVHRAPLLEFFFWTMEVLGLVAVPTAAAGAAAVVKVAVLLLVVEALVLVRGWFLVAVVTGAAFGCCCCFSFPCCSFRFFVSRSMPPSSSSRNRCGFFVARRLDLARSPVASDDAAVSDASMAEGRKRGEEN